MNNEKETARSKVQTGVNRLLRRLFIRPDTDAIIDDIGKNTEEWVQGQYCIKRKNHSQAIWTCNGFGNIDFHPAGVGAFNLFEKFAMMKAIRKHNRKKATC